MAEPAASWNEVASRFSGLGQKLRYHYQQVRTAEEENGAAPSGEGGTEQVNEAVRKLADAIDDVVDAVSAAVKDPAVKADVKGVGSALSDALSSSFADVSEDLRRAFRRRDGDTPDAPA